MNRWSQKAKQGGNKVLCKNVYRYDIQPESVVGAQVLEVSLVEVVQ